VRDHKVSRTAIGTTDSVTVFTGKIKNFAPDGYAARAKFVPLFEIKPSLKYEKICQAAGIRRV
jgi:hypothetical protein